MRRFTIAALMILVLVCGVAVAALKNASDAWAGVLLSITLVLLGVSILAILNRREDKRAFWQGFALFGWGYLILAQAPWFSDQVQPRLPSTQLLGYAHANINPSQDGDSVSLSLGRTITSGGPARGSATFVLTTPTVYSAGSNQSVSGIRLWLVGSGNLDQFHNTIVVYDGTTTGELTQPEQPVTARNAPAIVKAAGKSAEFAWEEFFQAEIANAHTRKNYMHAVRQFLAWVEERDLELPRIAPGDVGEYFQHLELAVPTKKLHLAALRRFFDRLVNRHVCVINPAATVKAERHSVVEGKTPDIGTALARTLLKSIAVADPVGLRDRAVLAVLAYTAARVGAVAKLTTKNFVGDGSQHTLRFSEKGGKSREIPVRHDLEQFLLEYIQAANIAEGPLFRTANRKSKTLTRNAMTGIDICRMMKRRLKAAGLPTRFSPHSFRVTTVTDLLEQNVPLEDVQYLAGHSDPRTTRIYDRRRRKVTRNIVERISI